MQLEQKIEDSAKAKSCSVHKGFDEDVEGISGGECNGQTSKQDVGCNAYVYPCLLACSCLVQNVEGQPKAYKSHFSWVGGLFRLVNKGCVMWTRASICNGPFYPLLCHCSELVKSVCNLHYL